MKFPVCKIEEKTCEEIIDDFEPKILKVVSKVTYDDCVDMKQEIKILEKMEMLGDLDLPGFVEFINEKNNN